MESENYHFGKNIILSILSDFSVPFPDLPGLVDRQAVLKLHKDYRIIFQNYCQGKISHWSESQLQNNWGLSQTIYLILQKLSFFL